MSAQPTKKKIDRSLFTIDSKEGETITKHLNEVGENNLDFKIRRNKKCTINVLDYFSSISIDQCEDCKIITGPVSTSIFIRQCKNCQISTIAKQVRLRDCENVKIFTFCPNDPAVEKSFNIYFAPYNAYFPHLGELFLKAGFDYKKEPNRYKTPYDFTADELLGGDPGPKAQKHFGFISKEDFTIEQVNDGELPLQEMYDGYSQSEEYIKDKNMQIVYENLNDNPVPDLNDTDNTNNEVLSKLEVENIKKLCFETKKKSDKEYKRKKYIKCYRNYQVCINKSFRIIRNNFNNKCLSEEDVQKLIHEYAVPSYVRLAKIDYKFDRWDFCVEHSSQALIYEKENHKALYFRCIGLINKFEFQKADQDLFKIQKTLHNTKKNYKLQKIFYEKFKEYNNKNNKKLRFIFLHHNWYFINENGNLVSRVYNIVTSYFYYNLFGNTYRCVCGKKKKNKGKKLELKSKLSQGENDQLLSLESKLDKSTSNIKE